MRAALALLLVFVFCGVPLSQVADAVPARVQRDIAAARALGAAFEWPSDERAADPTFAVEVLAEAAQAVGASVLRTSVSTGTDGRSRITHYVLSTGGTSLYRTLPLVEGRWPTDAESRHLGVVVSTEDTTSARIGRLQVLADGYALTVAPMAQAYESLPVAGTYVLEGADRATLDGFLARVGERLASRGAPPAVPTERASSGAADGSGSLLRFLPVPLLLIAVVVSAAVLLRAGKRIGVLRLLGFSGARVWFRVVGAVQAVATLVGVVAAAALIGLTPGVDAEFVRAVVQALLVTVAVSLATSLAVGAVVIDRVRITDLVKGGLS